jgi:dsRNA-specific ribonuclease
MYVEALTAPTSHRDYDYERLEFYGDSVISFLVILELFLTKDHTYKEGDLDFHRIKVISNMNFTKINKN